MVVMMIKLVGTPRFVVVVAVEWSGRAVGLTGGCWGFHEGFWFSSRAVLVIGVFFHVQGSRGEKRTSLLRVFFK